MLDFYGVPVRAQDVRQFADRMRLLADKVGEPARPHAVYNQDMRRAGHLALRAACGSGGVLCDGGSRFLRVLHLGDSCTMPQKLFSVFREHPSDPQCFLALGSSSHRHRRRLAQPAPVCENVQEEDNDLLTPDCTGSPTPVTCGAEVHPRVAEQQQRFHMSCC